MKNEDFNMLIDDDLIEEIRQMGMSDTRPSDTLRKLKSIGLSDIEMHDMVSKYSLMGFCDAGLGLIRYYSDLDRRWKDMYPPDKIDRIIRNCVLRRISER
jgi:hypothetical protein